MIKVKLTPDYTGFNIEGTFDDFYELYDNISYFLGIEECENIFEEDMRLHILGFLYDLRHAYQGSRNIKAVDNGLSEEQKEYYGINKSIKKDILYDFNYVVPEVSLCDSYLYDEYHQIKNEVEQYAKENNIIETEIEYGEYPEEIEW